MSRRRELLVATGVASLFAMPGLTVNVDAAVENRYPSTAPAGSFADMQSTTPLPPGVIACPRRTYPDTEYGRAQRKHTPPKWDCPKDLTVAEEISDFDNGRESYPTFQRRNPVGTGTDFDVLAVPRQKPQPAESYRVDGHTVVVTFGPRNKAVAERRHGRDIAHVGFKANDNPFPRFSPYIKTPTRQ